MATVNNYFRYRNATWTFNDASLESTRRAYEEARDHAHCTLLGERKRAATLGATVGLDELSPSGSGRTNLQEQLVLWRSVALPGPWQKHLRVWDLRSERREVGVQ